MLQVRQAVALLAVWVATLGAGGPAENVDTTAPTIRLRADRDVFARGEPIRVRVWMEVGSDDAWLAVIPHFNPMSLPLQTEAWPYPGLAFEIRDDNGALVPRRAPRKSFTDLAPPPLASEFVVVGGLEFFGREVFLTEGAWMHELAAVGRYRVKALVGSRAKEWLVREMRSGGIKRRDVHFPLDRIFEGMRESNEIEITIE